MTTKYRLDANPGKEAGVVPPPPPYVAPIRALDTSNYEPNPKISTRYDYKTIARPEVDFPSEDPNSKSITNQSDRDGADINLIMAKYEKTGLITDAITGAQRQPQYGDFTEVGDFYTNQIKIARVNQAFSALPAHIRSRFQNDPQSLINFLSDPQNDAEAIKLGLKPKPSDPAVTPEPNPGSVANPALAGGAGGGTPPATLEELNNQISKKNSSPLSRGERKEG